MLIRHNLCQSVDLPHSQAVEAIISMGGEDAFSPPMQLTRGPGDEAICVH